MFGGSYLPSRSRLDTESTSATFSQTDSCPRNLQAMHQHCLWNAMGRLPPIVAAHRDPPTPPYPPLIILLFSLQR